MDGSQIAACGKDAEELISRFLPLARQVVVELAGRLPPHVHRDELQSAAALGLVQAARSFDPGRGVPFEAYARRRIKGALVDELRTRDWASRSVRALARQVASTTDALTVALQRTPTSDEITEALDHSPDDVERLYCDLHRAAVIHLDSLPAAGEDLLPVDSPDAPSEALLAREREDYLHAAVAALPGRLRRVVQATFYHDASTLDLADELGVSESRVSQLRREAVELLRDGMNSHLDPHLVPEPERPGGRRARRRAAYYETIGSLARETGGETPALTVDA